MNNKVPNQTSRAVDLTQQILGVANRPVNTDTQRLATELPSVLAPLRKKNEQPATSPLPVPPSLPQKASVSPNSSPKVIRITLTLNQTTIELIEYLRSYTAANPLFGSIDICDESIDWIAAARFAKSSPVSPRTS